MSELSVTELVSRIIGYLKGNAKISADHNFWFSWSLERSFWLWWWLPLWLSKCESPLPTTVLLRTTLTWTIKLHYYMLPSGSKHLLYNKICGSIAWLSRIVLFRFNENKVYQLRVGNLSFPVYCHLSGTDLGPYGAGGWTLVMKIDGWKVMWLTLKFVIERVVSS